MSKILLVEDNEDNRDMLSRRLERRGYEILVAVDGLQAVNMARTHQPHLILMDMRLPELNGWEATQQLKASPETARIPIIGLSAHALVEDQKRAMEAGCDEYETKPVDFNRLVQKIDSMLQQSTGS